MWAVFNQVMGRGSETQLQMGENYDNWLLISLLFVYIYIFYNSHYLFV